MFKYILFVTLFISCQLAGISESGSYVEQISMESDSLLSNIQSKIDQAFIADISSNRLSSLESITQDLEEAFNENKQNLYSYWISYAEYHASIAVTQNGHSKLGEKMIDQAIKRLEKMSNKNSEDFAMLAMAQGFGIQFKGMKAMFISAAIKKNIKKAIELDPDNIRAFYVAGSNDYYTPAKYGGGEKVEEYLLKAVNMKDQQTPNSYLPSWGKEKAYEILIAHYIKNEDWENAKTQFANANQLYPSSYMINQMASKLVGK